MARRYYALPSLTSLAVFEAAARRLSQKLAAEELNVTPGAVSRQIKALEAELGTPLLRRVHRGVELTREGEELHQALSHAFGGIADAFHRLRTRGGGASVTIAATTAVASMWLMPRIGAFWRTHPEISVNHLISDDAREFRRADIDLRIRYGDGAWPDETAVALFGDRVFPVCGPGLAKRLKGLGIADLPAQTLLQLVGVDPRWTSWNDWFRQLEQAHPPLSGPHFNNYSIALQAAQDDQGIVLGWERLVRPLIEAGGLARVTDAAIVAPGRYFVTTNAQRVPTTEAAALRDWLIEQASRESD
ncbi:MAG: LysR family transcriptional regulator [Alphaproteobacteria bacterium]|nr:LysR family transcriptional regulator [Alphaproteobacteria bacterium]